LHKDFLSAGKRGRIALPPGDAFHLLATKKYSLHKAVETRINRDMPAPRPEYRDNPLRKLRMILGNGPKPMLQQEFSQLTGVSLPVVRAIESGRRGELAFKNCRNEIGQSTGATYGRDGQWHFMGRKDLYTYDHFLAFTRSHSPSFKNHCLHALLLRIVELFKSVSPQRWVGLFLTLLKAVEETAAKYEIKGRKGILENTEPEWAISQSVVVDGVRVDEPPRIFTRIRCFPGVEISDSTLEDDETLLDFRKWRESSTKSNNV
jgi:hypothetical protein